MYKDGLLLSSIGEAFVGENIVFLLPIGDARGDYGRGILVSFFVVLFVIVVLGDLSLYLA